MKFLPTIKQSTDAVINVSTGAGLGMSMDERLRAATTTSPEMASLNMGSMNFGIFPLLEKYSDWKHDWEPEFLGMTKDFIFPNTFATIEYALRELGEKHGTRFEFECYDLGHLYNVKWFVDQGLIKPPFFIQMVFGILGGMGAAGRHQMPFATQSAMMGGNLRVGLEDSLYIGRGELAVSNAQQVERIRGIIENLGLSVASPDEARTRLGLKGGDRVAF